MIKPAKLNYLSMNYKATMEGRTETKWITHLVFKVSREKR